jgi:cytochrome c
MDFVLSAPRAGLARRTRIASAALLALLLAAAGPARADDAIARGAELYASHCAECHSVRPGKDKKGPSLYAIVGERAARSPSFVYSDAMRASGIVWNDASLDAYLEAPARRVPGGKMKFDGLPDAAERAALIRYLSTLKEK